MSRRQIVFYDNQTRLVLKSVPGGTITKRTQILKYVPDLPLDRISFYYEDEDINVIPGIDRVLALFHGHTPFLCDPSGASKALYSLIKKRHEAISLVNSLKVDLRYGMGDQVTGLEALLEFSILYPQKKIYAGINPHFANIVPYLTPHPPLVLHGTKDLPPETYYVNLNRDIKLWDPRGGLQGLACLYGTEIGIEDVRQSVRLAMPPDDQQLWATRAGININDKHRPIIGIHIQCNSRSTASWKLQPALDLATLWHNKTNGDVFLVGDPAKWIARDPWTFTTSWPCDWASTAAVLLSLDLLVCVDSGPMHLGRAAGINQLIIWGGSGPGDILGRAPCLIDIRADINCINNICAGCPKGTNDCINLISSEMVWTRIQTLFPHLLNPHPINLGLFGTSGYAISEAEIAVEAPATSAGDPRGLSTPPLFDST